MRKFIAQSCAFLGTFRHSHAPLSPPPFHSLWHILVASISSPMPCGHTSPAPLCAHYRCAHTLRIYSSPMPCGHTSPAALCAHYRCAHTLRWPGYVLTNAPRIRPAFSPFLFASAFVDKPYLFPAFFPFFIRPPPVAKRVVAMQTRFYTQYKG